MVPTKVVQPEGRLGASFQRFARNFEDNAWLAAGTIGVNNDQGAAAARLKHYIHAGCACVENSQIIALVFRQFSDQALRDIYTRSIVASI